MNKLSKQQNSVSITNVLPNTTSKEISIYNAHLTEKRLKDFSTKDDLMLLNSLIVEFHCSRLNLTFASSRSMNYFLFKFLEMQI